MKKDNKTLYEQIMRNVSKQVKKALNENRLPNNYDNDFLLSINIGLNEADDTYFAITYDYTTKKLLGMPKFGDDINELLDNLKSTTEMNIEMSKFNKNK